MTRRNLLTRLIAGWSVLSTIPVLSVILKYLTPVEADAASLESIKLDSFAEIPLDSAKIVRFGKQPAIVVHTQGGQYKAFMARCTHLGCVVKYEGAPEVPSFHCNCHGSVFDINGRNIGGPAPRPLVPLKVSMQGESLVISTVSRS